MVLVNNKNTVKKDNLPSLVTSLTRTLFVGFIVVFIVMAVLVDFYGKQILQSTTDKRLDYIVTTQAKNSAQLLWDLETEKINTVLKNIVEDENIDSARIKEIFPETETVIGQYSWNDPINVNAILSRNIIYKNENGISRPLGVLEVVVNYESVEQQLLLIIWIAGFVFAGVFIILTSMVYYFLRRGIDPITKLSRSLVDVDYFTHKIDQEQHRTREVHDLFDALISMQTIMQHQTQEIQSQKAMLDTIFDKMPLGMFVEDVIAGQKLVLVNEMFKNLFNLRYESCVGRSVEQLLSEKDGEFMSFLNQTLIKRKKVVEVEARAVGADGYEFIAHVLKAPILNENGEVILIVGMVEDVTEQVEVRDNLVVAKEYAEKSNQAKSDFLTNMSHELRTPLNSIIGLTQILIDDGDFTLNQNDMMTTILQSSNMLLNTVNDILDLSKVEAEDIDFELVPFDLRKNIELILNDLKILAEQKSLDFITSWSSNVTPIVFGDPERFSRILINIGQNAIRYTDKGSVKISLDITNADGNHINVNYSVEDTGIGIADDKIDNIFDKFSQADDTINRHFGGIGLGLTIVKRFIELMSGNIFVKSVVGKGSIFTVNIPLQISSESLSSENNSERNSSITREKFEQKHLSDINVLVVEDQKMNQMLIRQLLPRLSIDNFKIVYDGAMALEEFEKNSYDLIIMDCHMPNMNGYEATRAIRNIEKSNNEKHPIFILAMTADAMVGTRDKCTVAGMDNYISKPVDTKKLLEILENWFC